MAMQRNGHGFTFFLCFNINLCHENEMCYCVEKEIKFQKYTQTFHPNI